MKTYAESIGQKPFNWLEFLRRNYWTALDLHEALLLSEVWPTCACGNQCASLPRTNVGAPMDDELAELGARFYTEISRAWRHYAEADADDVRGCMKWALDTFQKIEERSAQLLAEIEVDALLEIASDSWLPETEAEKELVLT